MKDTISGFLVKAEKYIKVFWGVHTWNFCNNMGCIMDSGCSKNGG